VNEKTNLKIFGDDYFDMIYSIIVLQHISDPQIIKSYISEFARILAKDGKVMIIGKADEVIKKYKEAI